MAEMDLPLAFEQGRNCRQSEPFLHTDKARYVVSPLGQVPSYILS